MEVVGSRAGVLGRAWSESLILNYEGIHVGWGSVLRGVGIESGRGGESCAQGHTTQTGGIASRALDTRVGQQPLGQILFVPCH